MVWWELKENFIQISRGKYINPKDFYIKTHLETVTTSSFEVFEIKIGARKPLKIFLNVSLTGTLFIDCEFAIYSYDTFGKYFEIKFGKSDGKKQYDGTYLFILDISKIKCYEYMQVAKYYGYQFITFNNFTIEFEESFQSIDYKSYKTAISNYIY